MTWSYSFSGRGRKVGANRHRVNDHHYLMFHSSRRRIVYPRTGGQYKGSKASLSQKPQTAAFACSVSYQFGQNTPKRMFENAWAQRMVASAFIKIDSSF